MFICCKTKPKKENQSNVASTVANSDSVSAKPSKVEEVSDKKEEPQATRLIQQPLQEECKYPEHQNMVKKIKSYRDQGKIAFSIEIEKSYVTSLIEQDLPTTHFVEFRWAINYTNFLDGRISKLPTKIENSKLLTEENKNKENVFITKENDPKLLPNLQPEKHYVLLNEQSWFFIHSLYGGGPSVEILLNQNASQPETINDAITFVSNNTKTSANTANTIPLDTQKNLNEPFFEGMKLGPMIVEGTQLTITNIDDVSNKNQTNIEDSSDKNNKTTISTDRDQQRTNTIKIQPRPKVIISYECPAIGLQNPKYFCYMNSALQILFSLQTLNEKMAKSKLQDRKFIGAYSDLIRKVLGQKAGASVLPDQIQTVCQKKFKYNLQQDAHEFMLFLLQSMQEELVGKVKYQKEQFANAQEAWDVYKARNPDIINDLFAGQITNKSYCLKCNGVSEGYDPIWDLNLPLQKHVGPHEIQLEECLQSYFQEEKIKDEWKCDQCKQINKIVLRRTQMSQTPKVLMIHLKRFSQAPKSQKITDDILYPQILDVKQFCSENVEKTKYELQGIISHMGQLNGGHYISYAQREQQWYQFDDDIVYKDKNNKHLSEKGAYILIYQQV